LSVGHKSEAGVQVCFRLGIHGHSDLEKLFECVADGCFLVTQTECVQHCSIKGTPVVAFEFARKGSYGAIKQRRKCIEDLLLLLIVELTGIQHVQLPFRACRAEIERAQPATKSQRLDAEQTDQAIYQRVAQVSVDAVCSASLGEATSSRFFRKTRLVTTSAFENHRSRPDTTIFSMW
jgi:hypothetical protein